MGKRINRRLENGIEYPQGALLSHRDNNIRGDAEALDEQFTLWGF